MKTETAIILISIISYCIADCLVVGSQASRISALERQVKAAEAQRKHDRQLLEETAKINTRLQHEVYRLREGAHER